MLLICVVIQISPKKRFGEGWPPVMICYSIWQRNAVTIHRMVATNPTPLALMVSLGLIAKNYLVLRLCRIWAKKCITESREFYRMATMVQKICCYNVEIRRNWSVSLPKTEGAVLFSIAVEE